MRGSSESHVVCKPLPSSQRPPALPALCSWAGSSRVLGGFLLGRPPPGPAAFSLALPLGWSLPGAQCYTQVSHQGTPPGARLPKFKVSELSGSFPLESWNTWLCASVLGRGGGAVALRNAATPGTTFLLHPVFHPRWERLAEPLPTAFSLRHHWAQSTGSLTNPPHPHSLAPSHFPLHCSGFSGSWHTTLPDL